MSFAKHLKLSHIGSNDSSAHHTIADLLVKIVDGANTKAIEATFDFQDAKPTMERRKVVSHGRGGLTDYRHDVLLFAVSDAMTHPHHTRGGESETEEPAMKIVYLADASHRLNERAERLQFSKCCTLFTKATEPEPQPLQADTLVCDLNRSQELSVA